MFLMINVHYVKNWAHPAPWQNHLTTTVVHPNINLKLVNTYHNIHKTIGVKGSYSRLFGYTYYIF